MRPLPICHTEGRRKDFTGKHVERARSVPGDACDVVCGDVNPSFPCRLCTSRASPVHTSLPFQLHEWTAPRPQAALRHTDRSSQDIA
jgi:hypothetical protein